MANQPAAERAAEAEEQEQSYTAWTVQQFSTNPVGEPYYALRAYDKNGDVIQGFTGTREEVNNMLVTNNLRATELPAVTEVEYYRRSVISGLAAPEQNAEIEPIVDRVPSDQGGGYQWREEQRAALVAAEARGESVPESFLAKEREQIREIQTAATQVPTEDLALHEAYLSGRRDSYNSLRDELLIENPELANTLPPSIDIDEIKVRHIAEQQKQDRSLEFAR